MRIVDILVYEIPQQKALVLQLGDFLSASLFHMYSSN